MDITVIVAMIAAISAIVAPVVTALINNRYQLKLRRIEMYEQKRIEVINEYASAVNSYLNHISTCSGTNFAKYKQTIFLYAPHSAWSIIEKMNNYIDEKELDKANALLPKLMKELSSVTFK